MTYQVIGIQETGEECVVATAETIEAAYEAEELARQQYEEFRGFYIEVRRDKDYYLRNPPHPDDVEDVIDWED
jgi:hypothetical protein